METNVTFPAVHTHAAGIDIGSEKFFISIDGSSVVSYRTFTCDYIESVEYLKKIRCKICGDGSNWCILDCSSRNIREQWVRGVFSQSQGGEAS